VLCKEIAELHDEIHKMNSLLHGRKVISPSFLAVFHNGKQEKFTFSYRKGIAFSEF
jgi:hypothetical protein